MCNTHSCSVFYVITIYIWVANAKVYFFLPSNQKNFKIGYHGNQPKNGMFFKNLILVLASVYPESKDFQLFKSVIIFPIALFFFELQACKVRPSEENLHIKIFIIHMKIFAYLKWTFKFISFLHQKHRRIPTIYASFLRYDFIFTNKPLEKEIHTSNTIYGAILH